MQARQSHRGPTSKELLQVRRGQLDLLIIEKSIPKSSGRGARARRLLTCRPNSSTEGFDQTFHPEDSITNLRRRRAALHEIIATN